MPAPGLDLRQWLDVSSEPDLVAVALQEIVPLNAANVVIGENCFMYLGNEILTSSEPMSATLVHSSLQRQSSGGYICWQLIHDKVIQQCPREAQAEEATSRCGFQVDECV